MVGRDVPKAAVAAKLRRDGEDDETIELFDQLYHYRRHFGPPLCSELGEGALAELRGGGAEGLREGGDRGGGGSSGGGGSGSSEGSRAERDAVSGAVVGEDEALRAAFLAM